MKKARIEVIDIAKAITIFLVILGHTTGDAFYKRVVYSFHMPLFFMLSGMSSKSKFVAWHNFIRKNISAIVIPFIIWAMIYAPFSFRNLAKIFYASWETLGRSGSLTSLWFLSCLFSARIIVQLLTNLQKSNVNNLSLRCCIMAVPMFIIGFVMIHTKYGMPWCMDIAFVASGFMLLGMAMRRAFIIFTQQTMPIIWLIFSASLVIFSAGTIFRSHALDLVFMCAGNYGSSIFWFMWNSISGSVLILSVSSIFARTLSANNVCGEGGMIARIGSGTMGIFLLHKHIAHKIMALLTENIMPINTPLILTALTGSVITLGVSVTLCAVIERYIPQIFGHNENQTIL